MAKLPFGGPTGSFFAMLRSGVPNCSCEALWLSSNLPPVERVFARLAFGLQLRCLAPRVWASEGGLKSSAYFVSPTSFAPSGLVNMLFWAASLKEQASCALTAASPSGSAL